MGAIPRDFRAMGADGKLEAPFMGMDYGDRTIAGRPIQADGKRYWLTGVRLGFNASGQDPSAGKSVNCAPPDLRGTSVSELLAVLSAPAQLGYSPTMNRGSKVRRGRSKVRWGL